MRMSSQVSFTRPNNTTAYSGGDVVGVPDSGTPANAGSAVLTFSSDGAGDLLTNITSTELMIALGAVPGSMTSFLLHLYSASPPSALLDNAAWDLPSGDRSVYLGSVTMGTPADIGSTLYIQTTGLSKRVKAGASGTLWGYLVTAGGYTPAAYEAFTLRLHSEGVRT